MKIRISIVLTLFVLCERGRAQGFINFNFESANLSPVPAGQFGGEVSSLDAIPGWTASVGTNQLTQVLQNNLTLGNASVDILGPSWNSYGIIQGQYTVVLQPGANPFGNESENVSAFISQTGVVPANAEALTFLAVLESSVSVTLDGQNLSLIDLGTSGNATLYGANIPTSLGGLSETLTITALAAPNAADYFDSFAFSPTVVPEPGTLGLCVLGGLFLAWKARSVRLY